MKQLTRGQCTLLIPSVLYLKISRKKVLNGRYFTNLIHKMLTDPDIKSKLTKLNSERVQKKYQDKGLNLHRVDFYPEHSDWAQITGISHAKGFSVCYIFTYLLLCMLNKDSIQFTGVPSHSNKFDLVCIYIVSIKNKELIRILDYRPE